jgi:hypothetical protein
MAGLRAARVVYQVHSPRIAGLAAAELGAILARHPVPTGHVAVDARDGPEARGFARDTLPAARDFDPPLEFEPYAQLRQARWIARVEATEIEPENLAYLRSALFVAGEIAALTGGVLVDTLAYRRMAPEDVVREVERPFDPLHHVTIHVDRGERPFFVHTHGMEKFAHRDFELHGVPRESLDVARRLLRHLAAAVVSGGCFEEGDRGQLCGFGFEFGPPVHDVAGHFGAGSLALREFRLVTGIATPEMEGMHAS